MEVKAVAMVVEDRDDNGMSFFMMGGNSHGCGGYDNR